MPQRESSSNTVVRHKSTRKPTLSKGPPVGFVGCCMCHADWDVTDLFTLRRGWSPRRPAASHHLSSSPLLILISLCCSQHSLLILLSRSRSQPFPALISKNKNKYMSENTCQRINVSSVTVTDAEMSLCMCEGLLFCRCLYQSLSWS